LDEQNEGLDTYKGVAVSSAKEAVLITAVNLAVSAAVSPLFRYHFPDILGIVFLLEGAVLFLVGGALGFGGQAGFRSLARLMGGRFERKGPQHPTSDGKGMESSEQESVRKNDVRAAFYLLTGVLLFFEGMGMALLLQ
jgi:hypothetical protein